MPHGIGPLTPAPRRVLLTGSLFLVASLPALTLAGCKADPAVQKGAVIERGVKIQPQPAPISPYSPAADGGESPDAPVTQRALGQISGQVNFAGKPPARIVIDTSMDPACSHASGAPVLTEQYVINGGKLANVFIYVKSGPPAATHTPLPANAVPVVMNQLGCQYLPHVIAVPAGGYVQFQNSDATMHNIHTMPAAVGNETVDISEGPRGAPIVKQFARPELMMPVRCNNHPWMNAFINVSSTPFFAVSDEHGHFALRGLPPGDYVLAAVHEKLGERDINVTVKPNGAATAEVTFAAK